MARELDKNNDSADPLLRMWTPARPPLRNILVELLELTPEQLAAVDVQKLKRLLAYVMQRSLEPDAGRFEADITRVRKRYQIPYMTRIGEINHYFGVVENPLPTNFPPRTFTFSWNQLSHLWEKDKPKEDVKQCEPKPT